MRRFRAPKRPLSFQRGFAMLDLSMALIVMASLSAVNLSAKALADKLQFAEMQGNSLSELSSTGATYTQEFFTELQSGLNIHKNDANLTSGHEQGQTLSPTVSDFVNMGYLHKGYSSEASYVQSGTPGKYLFHIDRTGQNCLTDPATCTLDGYVYIDKPVTGPGGVDMDGPALHAMLNKLGNKGCVSLLDNPSIMVGLDGDCGIANPVPGNPPGVALVRFGFGSSGFSMFVRNHDIRDIELLGNFEVAKTASADMFTTPAKTLGAPCPTNNALASGTGMWLVCVSNTWQSVGGPIADFGASCNPDGKVATSKTTGEQLICKNGVYIKSTSLISKMVIMSRQSVIDGQIVQKPVCDLGGTPNRSFLMTQTTVDLTVTPPKQAMYVTTSDIGNAWEVIIRLKDDTGAEASGNDYAISQVLNLECLY